MPPDTADLQRLLDSLALDEGAGVYLVHLGYPRDAETLGASLATLGRVVARISMVRGLDARERINELAEPRDPASLLWLDLREAAPEDHDDFAWFFSRLNERRNGLLQIAPCPWIIGGPQWLMRSLRGWAPDLWSVRRGEFVVGPVWTAPQMESSQPELGRLVGAVGGPEQATARELLALRQVTNEQFEREQGKGTLERARPLAEALLSQSRQLLALDPRRPEWLHDLAVSLTQVGNIEMLRGAPDNARVVYGEALSAMRVLLSLEPDRPEWLFGVSATLDKVAQVDRTRGDIDGARAACAEGLLISQKLLLIDPNQPEWMRPVAVSLDRLGDIDRDRGAIDSAHSAYAQSLELRRRLLRSDPTRTAWLHDLSASLTRMGDIHHRRGALGDARSAYSECLQVVRSVLLVDPDRADWLRNLCIVLLKLGDLYRADGELGNARAAFAEGLELCRRLLLLEPERPDRLSDLVSCLALVGTVEVEEGALEEAHASFMEAAQISESLATRLKTQQANTEAAACLGRLAAFDHSLDRQVLERALAFARTGHRLAPAVQRGRHLLATLLRFKGDAESIREAGLLEMGRVQGT